MQKRAVSRATVPVESALLAQRANGGIGDERRSGREGFEMLGRRCEDGHVHEWWQPLGRTEGTPRAPGGTVKTVINLFSMKWKECGNTHKR